MVYTLEPLFAALVASLVLKEAISPNAMIGALFITGACLWNSLGCTPKTFFSRFAPKRLIKSARAFLYSQSGILGTSRYET